MGKQLNIGVADKARKGKKAYIGVANIARKIKKMYIGVAGIARLFWSGGLSKASNATPLSVGRHTLAGSYNQNYALFGGGRAANTYSAVVDAYNKSLVRSAPAELKAIRQNLAGTSSGDKRHALFAGGQATYPNDFHDAVDVYDNSLVKVSTSALTVKRKELAGASNNTFAMFAGGRYGGASGYSSHVDAYDNSLVKSRSGLDFGSYNLAGASVGNYIIFAGGSGNEGAWDIANAINLSLVKTRIGSLSEPVSSPAGASVGNYALIANPRTGAINYYTSDLVRGGVSLDDAPIADLKGVSLEEFAFFIGHYYATKKRPTIFNAALVKIPIEDTLENITGVFGLTKVSNCVLIGGGGSGGSQFISDVEVYEF